MLLLKAVPELMSAGLMLALWIHPMLFGIEWFRAGVLTLLLEFFVIHASGFMAVLMFDPRAQRVTRSILVAAIGALYLLFISAFAWGMDAWWMLGAFAWLCFGKIQAIWTDAAPTESDRSVAVASWAASMAAFLGSVAATAFLEVPRLGVTWKVVDATGWDTRGGLWQAEPQRALAGAVLYFAIMGLSRPLFAYWQESARPAPGR